MSVCSLCGKEFDGRNSHMIYAFVGDDLKEEPETRELCPAHTDKLINAMRSI